MQQENLKELLDKIYVQYKKKYSSKDPVWVLHRFSDERDVEIMGLITSAYTYGQVDVVNRHIENLLKRIGNKPHEFTINFEKRKDKKRLKGLYYRFNTEEHLVNLFAALGNIINEYGSLKNLFVKYYDPGSHNVMDAVRGFSSAFNGKLGFLFPRNENAAYKRMNLFLRWMVRRDEIDLGIWNEIGTSKLLMPVDVHVARISKQLGLVSRKTVDIKFAVELTNKLKEFDPLDPVKYDFSLCHLGVEGKELS